MRHFEVLEGRFQQTTLLRSKMLKAARDWFGSNDFMEICVPHITGATGSCEWFPNAMAVTMYEPGGEEQQMFCARPANSIWKLSPTFTIVFSRLAPLFVRSGK